MRCPFLCIEVDNDLSSSNRKSSLTNFELATRRKQSHKLCAWKCQSGEKVSIARVD